MKKRIVTLTLALTLLLDLLIPAGAAEKNLPSLFCNDEVWYKDSTEPLVIRDGAAFVPAEFWSMFDGVTVTEPTPGNLLVQHTETGRYLSVLYPDCSAAVNGEIVENIGVLRNDGMYYLEAGLTCTALGLFRESYTAQDGAQGLRITDENSLLTLDELLETYTYQSETYETEKTDDGDDLPAEKEAPQLFLFCGTDVANVMYPALTSIRAAGLAATVFLDGHESPEAVASAAVCGEIGLILPRTATGEADFAALETLNETAARYTGRSTRFVYCGTADREAVRKAGYFPVTADLVSIGGTDAESLWSDVCWTLREKGKASVWLGDYWVSHYLTERLAGVGEDEILIVNLADGR